MNNAWNSEDWFWKRTILYSAAAAIVVIGGAMLYYYKFVKPGQDISQQPQPPPAASTETPAPAPEREHHPLPQPAEPPAAPLPPLNESDSAVAQALSDVVGRRSVEQYLVPERVIRNFVVTVDNLPRNKVAEQMRPVKPLGGRTLVVTNGDTIMLSAENDARYTPIVRLLQNTDIQQIGALYLRFYPLLQQAYEDLGYPGEYFNDRLVEVIDHLLQTPEVRGPIELKQGRVFYEFADPDLESRSAGQKLLLRMGSANAAIVKRKLRELRTFVTTSQDPPARTSSQPAAGTSAEAPAGPAEGDVPEGQPLPDDTAR